jgi:hypothetical protein
MYHTFLPSSITVCIFRTLKQSVLAQAIRESVTLLVEKSIVAKFIPSFVSRSTGSKAEIKGPCTHTHTHTHRQNIDIRLPTCYFFREESRLKQG